MINFSCAEGSTRSFDGVRFAAINAGKLMFVMYRDVLEFFLGGVHGSRDLDGCDGFRFFGEHLNEEFSFGLSISNLF